jgi:ribosomal protein S18 acetylase RimI-like enzyme
MLKVEIDKNGGFDIMINGAKVGTGCMMLAEDEDDFTYLERIDILDGQRGKGYGTEAINILKGIYGSLYLTPDNKDAKRLYEKLGREISSAEYDRFGFAIDTGFGVYEV